MENGLTIDWKILLGQIINFAILLFLLQKLVYKPLFSLLKQRREKIEEGIKKSAEAEEKLSSLLQVKKRMEEEAEEKRKQVLIEAEKQGQERIKEKMENAEKEREQVLLKAKKEAEELKEKEKEELLRESVDNAFALAEAVLKENIDKEKNKALTQEFLNKLKT